MKINLEKEYELSDDVIGFIENTILPALGLEELNDDNIDDIGEFAANIEVEYVGVKGLTKEEKRFYRLRLSAYSVKRLFKKLLRIKENEKIIGYMR